MMPMCAVAADVRATSANLGVKRIFLMEQPT